MGNDFNVDFCILANNKPIVEITSDMLCSQKTVLSDERMDVWSERFRNSWTLDDWINQFPELAQLSYVELSMNIVAGNGQSWMQSCLWTRANSITYTADDGWTAQHKLTEHPVVFRSRFSDDVFNMIMPDGRKHYYAFHCIDPNRRFWLYKDINNMDGTQTDYVAEIKIPENEAINWGFNGFNAVLLFREMCKTHIKTTPSGKQYHEINYRRGIGAWMQDITLDTMKRYVKDIIDVTVHDTDGRRIIAWRDVPDGNTVIEKTQVDPKTS